MIKVKVWSSMRVTLNAGGTFVLYMVLSRYLHLDNHTPSLSTEDSLTLTISETIDSTADLSGRPVKGQWIKNNKIARIALLLWCLFGASAVIADGLLTPAVSVISAVTGNFITFFTDLFRNCCPGPQPQQFHRPYLYRDSRCSRIIPSPFTINGIYSSSSNNSVQNIFLSSSLQSLRYGSQLFLLPAL
jgi:hypothetical protein